MIEKNSSMQRGFGNYFCSETEAGILPPRHLNPQKHPKNLYAEQLSGSAFTAPAPDNLRTWVYRRKPSVYHQPLHPVDGMGHIGTSGLESPQVNFEFLVNPVRWLPRGDIQKDFLTSLQTLVGCGSWHSQTGFTVFDYAFSKSCEHTCFQSHDGELFFVHRSGRLLVTTELGQLRLEPGEVMCIPRGLRFRFDSIEGDAAEGYLLENYGSPFKLPYRGPIGANGLANEKDFYIPTAFADPLKHAVKIYSKVNGQMYRTESEETCMDVLGWQGNLAPYKYNLYDFSTIGSILFDHPDPSIFTVLTSPSPQPGVANCDVVLFGPRWLVAEGTFRPPYFHRNTMNEFMGLIEGVYDAKPQQGTTGSGFFPGGASLHNQGMPHGPDAEATRQAQTQSLAPKKLDNTLAFMFESRWVFAVNTRLKDRFDADYLRCWDGF